MRHFPCVYWRYFKKSPQAIRYVTLRANNGRYSSGLSEVEKWEKFGIRVPPPSGLDSLFDTRWSDEISISGLSSMFNVTWPSVDLHSCLIPLELPRPVVVKVCVRAFSVTWSQK